MDAGSARLHCNVRSQPKSALIKRNKLLLTRLVLRWLVAAFRCGARVEFAADQVPVDFRLLQLGRILVAHEL